MYEDVLGKENTRALMFMFGRYISVFYYRDSKWIKELLPKIFPQEDEKKHLYLASWEGYLTSNLHKEIFEDEDFQDLYKRGLALQNTKDPTRENSTDLEKGLATHFAFAFMCYDNFDFDHSLFKEFWQKHSSQKHIYFVRFLGGRLISSNEKNAKMFIKDNVKSQQKLKELWDYLLSDKYDNPEVLVAMGQWMTLKNNIFKPQWLAEHIRRTVEKTKGNLDIDSRYNLLDLLPRLAKNSPQDTLEIMHLCLLKGNVHSKNILFSEYHIDKEIFDVFKILYENADTKTKTTALINQLIQEGGRAFWDLKKILGPEDPEALDKT